MEKPVHCSGFSIRSTSPRGSAQSRCRSYPACSHGIPGRSSAACWAARRSRKSSRSSTLQHLEKAPNFGSQVAQSRLSGSTRGNILTAEGAQALSVLHQISGCQSATRKADVVFIHGLGGDAFATWRHGKDDTASWPHWLGQEFPEVGVWSVGYSASPSTWPQVRGWFSKDHRDAGHGMSLPDRALEVLDLMSNHGLGERPLFLICHSLGGLLAKQILRASCDAAREVPASSIFANTRSVLFLATPHAGAELASLADSFRELFGATVTIQDLRAHDAHLRELFNWYRNHAPSAGIQTATYYEGRKLKGVTIVNPTSAHPGVGADPVPLDEDHFSIVKPRARDAQVCLAAGRLLRNYVLSVGPGRTPAATPPPAPTVNATGIVAGVANVEAVPDRPANTSIPLEPQPAAEAVLQTAPESTSIPPHYSPRPTQRASETKSSRQLQAFLCHSSGDKPAVRGLYKKLQQDGLQPWLDEENILPGQNWRREIERAVRASDVVIVCISHSSTTKEGFVQKEIKYVLDVAEEKPEGVIFVIPLRLEDCAVPERLREWHWVNLFDIDGYERLLRALRERETSHETPAEVTPTLSIQEAYFSQDKRGIAILAEVNNPTTDDQQLLGWTLEIPSLQLTIPGGQGPPSFWPGAPWWQTPPFVIEAKRGTGPRAVFFWGPPAWDQGLPAEPLHATFKGRVFPSHFLTQQIDIYSLKTLRERRDSISIRDPLDPKSAVVTTPRADIPSPKPRYLFVVKLQNQGEPERIEGTRAEEPYGSGGLIIYDGEPIVARYSDVERWSRQQVEHQGLGRAMSPTHLAKADKKIRRLKKDWELNQQLAPHWDRRAKDILRALHAIVGEIYSEVEDQGTGMAANLAGLALEKISDLENVQFMHGTDMAAYWKAGDEVFSLIETFSGDIRLP
jgi:hypothetical protein